MKIPPSDMLIAAKAVLPNAYAPYSNFSVAACVRTQSGDLFAGCNVENASYNVGLCAESGAISAAIAQGHRQIVEVLVLVASHKICSPCGACRQRLLESASPNMTVHMCTLDGKYETATLAELLPHAFDAHNLEEEQ